MLYCSLLLLASWAIIRARYPHKLLRLQMSELTCKQPPMTRDQIIALVVTTGTVRTALCAAREKGYCHGHYILRLCVFVPVGRVCVCVVGLVCVCVRVDARGWMVRWVYV
jgi:hypothetical protein